LTQNGFQKLSHALISLNKVKLNGARAIAHLEKPLYGRFSGAKLYLYIIFASIHTYFPESGSGERFYASGMHAIDSPHKITPIGVKFRKK
jgi:hypothetical protein